VVPTEDAKRHAAERAVDYIQSGSVIGLGTGSTMQYAIEEIGRRLRTGELSEVLGVPTSERTGRLAHRVGVPLTTLADHPELELTIDGADEIDPALDLIKGLGGALLREKIVASAARELVIVADEGKLVPILGSRVPLPVEVVPFALAIVERRLAAMGGGVELRRTDRGEPLVTDEGNRILDYFCGPIQQSAELDVELRRIPGVVEHGLFLGMARRAIVCRAPDDVIVMHRPAARQP
jgi:ribose 5-phosphate isomerase A